MTRTRTGWMVFFIAFALVVIGLPRLLSELSISLRLGQEIVAATKLGPTEYGPPVPPYRRHMPEDLIRLLRRIMTNSLLLVFLWAAQVGAGVGLLCRKEWGRILTLFQNLALWFYQVWNWVFPPVGRSIQAELLKGMYEHADAQTRALLDFNRFSSTVVTCWYIAITIFLFWYLSRSSVRSQFHG